MFLLVTGQKGQDIIPGAFPKVHVHHRAAEPSMSVELQQLGTRSLMRKTASRFREGIFCNLQTR